MNERSNSSRIIKPTASSNIDDDGDDDVDAVVVNEERGIKRRQGDYREATSSGEIAGVSFSSSSSTTDEVAEMILGKLSTTTSSTDRDNNSNSSNNNNNSSNGNLEPQQSIVVLASASFVPIRITNYIGGEIFESLICSRYLDSDDMISLLQINGIIESFPQICQRYCAVHGTKLDLTYEDYSERRRHHQHHRQQQERDRDRDPDSDRADNDSTINVAAAAAAAATAAAAAADNDNDAQFFSWWLEQQAFISADNNKEELPSRSPDCFDCRIARFHQKKKCPCCNDYVYYEEIFTCDGQCQKTACTVNEGMRQCGCIKVDCPSDGLFCFDCFKGYYCEPCGEEYNSKCMPPRVCDGDACGEHICIGCADADHSEAYTCGACNSFFCGGCREYGWCSKCEQKFCDSCRTSYYCVFCDKAICFDCDKSGGIECSDCGEPSCSECGMVNSCRGCDSLYCHRCQSGFHCEVCKAVYCDECRPNHASCSSCDGLFCTNCQEGSFVTMVGWLCTGCNEEEEDACANCFLSEGDMDDVNLKKCSGCKTVKYCSRACQKDDWKVHRAVCNAAAAAVSDGKMKGTNK